MDKQKFNELWNKYKDVIPYVFWGVMTTLINIASYWLNFDISETRRMLIDHIKTVIIEKL